MISARRAARPTPSPPQDVTAYHNTVPEQYLEFALQLEAERMRQPACSPTARSRSEREVVKEEKRMRLENSPIGRALEAIDALAYHRTPLRLDPCGRYRRTSIG